LNVRPSPGGRYDHDDATMIETVALQLGVRLHSKQHFDAESAFRQLAASDSLTGVANRRTFDETLALEWRRCARSGFALGLILLDVDYFKRYNDAYGHVAGDACLIQVAKALAAFAKRPGDVVARYGGEEFAIILPECDAAGLTHVGESICEAVRFLNVAHEGSSLGYVTISAGGASIVPHADGPIEGLVTAADARLYEAKGAGRNRVACDGHVSPAPAVRPHGFVRHNLPRYLTAMVGRDRESGEIEALLRESPLVTIVGMGGLGKTRVAVRVSGSHIDDFEDGVWFVDLARVSDPSLVATSVANAIGFELSPTQEAASALAVLLRPQHTLIVLDNCEHVIVEAATLAERLIRQCPRLAILATGREPLGVAGEAVYRLDPLDETTALALFVERAQRSDRRFPLSESESLAILEICRRLDGIALAIELAAARVRVIPPRQLLARLRERLGPLQSEERGAPARHQTIRSLVDWSYDLLDGDERRVFRCLGVFTGSFTLDAAVRIAYDDDGGDPQTAVARIFALVDKSLLAALPGDVARYRMLDPIRHYAIGRLEESHELERSRRAHALFFAELSADARNTWGTVSDETWLARFEPDLDNFRTAFDWTIGADARLAASIAGNLGDLWYYGGLLAEGRVRSEAALAALGGIGAQDEPDALQIWIAVSRAAWEARLLQRCIDAGERALVIAQRTGNIRAIADALYLTGRARFLGGVAPERGLQEMGEAVERFRSSGNSAHAARALSMYGYALATGEGRLAEGRVLQTEGLELARSAGLPHLVLTIEISLSETEFASGDVASAIERARRAVGTLRSRKFPFLRVVALGNLASYLSVAEEYEEAGATAREAVSMARAYELNSRIPPRVQAVALAEAARGDARLAARLLGFVDASYEERGATRERTEAIVHRRLLDVLNERLAPDAIAQEIALGRALSFEAACDLAT
jgi:diguanylate cyclase (GGDEF)-like protein